MAPTTFGNTTAFYYPYGQSNPQLSVEVSSEFEVGFDALFTLLKNTNWLNDISIAPTYWKRRTESSIYSVDTAPSLGIGTLRDNAFTLGSHGLRVALNATMYNGSALKWHSTVNYGKQTSEIEAISTGQPVVVTSNAGSTNYVLTPGQKIGQLFGYRMIHSVDATDESGAFYIPAIEGELFCRQQRLRCEQDYQAAFRFCK